MMQDVGGQAALDACFNDVDAPMADTYVDGDTVTGSRQWGPTTVPCAAVVSARRRARCDRGQVGSRATPEESRRMPRRSHSGQQYRPELYTCSGEFTKFSLKLCFAQGTRPRCCRRRRHRRRRPRCRRRRRPRARRRAPPWGSTREQTSNRQVYVDQATCENYVMHRNDGSYSPCNWLGPCQASYDVEDRIKCDPPPSPPPPSPSPPPTPPPPTPPPPSPPPPAPPAVAAAAVAASHAAAAVGLAVAAAANAAAAADTAVAAVAATSVPHDWRELVRWNLRLGLLLRRLLPGRPGCAACRTRA